MSSLFYFFSWVGDWERVVLIGLAIMAILIWYGWTREAIIIFTTVLSAKLLSILFKYFFAADRPDPSVWLTDASGFSFPSGHATVAMALYGTLGIMLWPCLDGKKKYVAAFLCTLFVLGIGVSRLVLGVHWPNDVLGGWFLGFLTAIAVIRLFRIRGKN